MNQRMKRWCDENAKNPKVRAWLKDHPPPKEWTGSRLEWAFTEMASVDVVVDGIASFIKDFAGLKSVEKTKRSRKGARS